MARITRTWAQLKALISLKSPAYQIVDYGRSYSAWFTEADDRYECVVNKSDPASEDQQDLETNYLPGANNATFNVQAPFAANIVAFKGNSVVAQTVAGNGQPHNLDLKMTADRLLNGGILYVTGAKQQDWIKAQVVDKDSLIPAGPARDAYPNWPVLNEWIEMWGIIPGHPMDLETPQAGKIPALMWVRIIYNPTNDSIERTVTINYRLNKKL